MTIVEVIGPDGNIVSKFIRAKDSCNRFFWTQHFKGTEGTITFNETIVNENQVHLFDNKALVSLTFEPCEIHMYIDAGKRIKMFPECQFKVTYTIEEDDNEDIMDLLKSRLALGKQRYGHGVRIDDDTRQWGTDTDSWETMMMEEALDGMIYAAAQLLRIQKRRKQSTKC